MLKRNAGTTIAFAVFLTLSGAPLTALALPAGFAPMQTAATAPTRVLGTVTSVGNGTLTVKSSSGNSVTVTVTASTRVLRLEPGQKTLSAATPIQLTDISTGDRALVSATAGSGNTLTANLIVAMKHSDIAARQHAEEEDWQRNGVGGIVKSVDPASKTIVLASAEHDITIQVPASASIRKYAEDSVAFKDTQPSSLSAIQPGDQLRAKGPHSADGRTVTANAIVFGNFQNIAGLVLSVDPSAKTLTLKDLATKKPVTLAVNDDSTLRQLPDRVAEFVAMRLQAMKEAKKATAGQGNQESPQAHSHPRPEAGPMGAQPGGFNRVLDRATPIQLSALHKGDAVMVVASKGSNGNPGTALTLLSGVAPMFRASRKASQSMFSSSWSLGGGQSAGNSGSSGGEQQGGSSPQQK
jgi:preprotein translocase subunit YajC